MPRLDMALLGAELDCPPRFFLTREKGEQAYPRLRDELERCLPGTPLLLVFPPRQLLDASFVDESLIRLGEHLMDGTLGDRGLLLQGLGADSITNLEAVIGFRRLKLAFLAIGPGSDWRTVGHIEPTLAATLDLVAHAVSITAPELARTLELALNTANNRLKRLHDQHLLRRSHAVTKKGLEYTYHFWQWEGEEDRSAAVGESPSLVIRAVPSGEPGR
jgi:hypothetical protein